jgi:hypothetical protein
VFPRARGDGLARSVRQAIACCVAAKERSAHGLTVSTFILLLLLSFPLLLLLHCTTTTATTIAFTSFTGIAALHY